MTQTDNGNMRRKERPRTLNSDYLLRTKMSNHSILKTILLITSLAIVTAPVLASSPTAPFSSVGDIPVDQQGAAKAEGAVDPQTRVESQNAAKPKKNPPVYAESVPSPTHTGVKYGPHGRNIFDFWQATSDSPTPLVLVIHGGGWNGGMKEDIHKFVDVSKLLQSGISVAAIQYRLIKHTKDLKPPVKGPLHDSAHALQFLRYNATKWNIDPTRIGAAGGSAGGCTSLWLAYRDDLADPKNEDPVLRESTRLLCAAVTRPQTTLDPKQMKDWMPNSKYGAHAFGIKDFKKFLAERENIAAWLAEYSPYALASADDPPVYLFFTQRPAMGKPVKDPTHSSNFGIGLQRHCKELGIGCEVMFPGASGVEHETTTDFLIATLKPNTTP